LCRSADHASARSDAPRPFRCPLVPLIPILGIVFCLLLMFSLPVDNCLRLILWLLGLAVYFAYGRHHSVLARMKNVPERATPRSF
jgi:C-terminus of AA_permease